MVDLERVSGSITKIDREESQLVATVSCDDGTEQTMNEEDVASHISLLGRRAYTEYGFGTVKTISLGEPRYCSIELEALPSLQVCQELNIDESTRTGGGKLGVPFQVAREAVREGEMIESVVGRRFQNAEVTAVYRKLRGELACVVAVRGFRTKEDVEVEFSQVKAAVLDCLPGKVVETPYGMATPLGAKLYDGACYVDLALNNGVLTVPAKTAVAYQYWPGSRLGSSAGPQACEQRADSVATSSIPTLAVKGYDGVAVAVGNLPSKMARLCGRIASVADIEAALENDAGATFSLEDGMVSPVGEVEYAELSDVEEETAEPPADAEDEAYGAAGSQQYTAEEWAQWGKDGGYGGGEDQPQAEETGDQVGTGGACEVPEPVNGDGAEEAGEGAEEAGEGAADGDEEIITGPAPGLDADDSDEEEVVLQ